MLVAPAVLALGLAAAPADTVSFRFAWPEAVDASVEYRGSKTRPAGLRRELRLNGRLVARTKGEEIRVRYEDWRSVGGGKPDPLIEAAGRITTVVSKNGEFVRVDDIEPALKAVAAAFDSAPAEARPILERLAKMGPALLTKGANENWALLAQYWNGAALDLGEDYESDSEAPVQVFPGEKVRVHAYLRVERRLPCPSGGGACVEVRLRTEPDPADVERILKRFVAELGLPLAQLDQALGEVAATTESVLVTEPGRLVPHRLEKRRTVRVRAMPDATADTQSLTRSDVEVWTFTYAASPATRH